MPLPEFRPDGWLPEGHHSTTWAEIALRFGGEPGSRRAAVLTGLLLAWRDAVFARGMGGLLILDGSFISQKAAPGELLRHTTVKNQFGGDIFVYSAISVRNSPEFCRTDGFDREKVTRRPKGVVEVML